MTTWRQNSPLLILWEFSVSLYILLYLNWDENKSWNEHVFRQGNEKTCSGGPCFRYSTNVSMSYYMSYIRDVLEKIMVIPKWNIQLNDSFLSLSNTILQIEIKFKYVFQIIISLDEISNIIWELFDWRDKTKRTTQFDNKFTRP